MLRSKSSYLKASQDKQLCENWVPRFFNYLDVNQRHVRLRFIFTKNNKNVEEFIMFRTAYGPEIILYFDTFHAVTARGCNKIIWWKWEQVAINWASRNSSLHKLHQSLEKCLCRVICCQSETFYYRINHRFNPCLFYSYCSHYLFNMLHKLYSDV